MSYFYYDGRKYRLRVNSIEEMIDAVEERMMNHPRAENESGKCVYRFRNEDDTVDHSRVGCAIGCLILDEDYTPEIEGHGASQFDWPTNEWAHIAVRLQGIHDDLCSTIRGAAIRLQQVRYDYERRS